MNSEGDVITKWYDVGLELLDSDNGALDVINKNYPNDNEKCCTEMFKKWLQCRPDASWHQLAEALTSVNFRYNMSLGIRSVSFSSTSTQVHSVFLKVGPSLYHFVAYGTCEGNGS